MLRKKVWSFGLILGMAFGLCACPPTLYINNSFRQAVTVPLAAGMVSLNRGESIDLKKIIKMEKVKPEKIVITRLFGTYFLTASGFHYVWKIVPKGREQASFTKIEIAGLATLKQPKLLHSEDHNCVTLVTGDTGAEQRWNIHPSGQVGRKCTDVSSN